MGSNTGQTAESVFLYDGLLVAEIKGLKITYSLMQETLKRGNMYIW